MDYHHNGETLLHCVAKYNSMTHLLLHTGKMLLAEHKKTVKMKQVELITAIHHTRDLSNQRLPTSTHESEQGVRLQSTNRRCEIARVATAYRKNQPTTKP